MTGALLAGLITRKASLKAFQKRKYSMIAPDIFEFISEAFTEVIGDI